MNIRVYVSTDEQSLFGPEQAPEGYDANSLLDMVKAGIKASYPGADVEVIGGNHQDRVELEDAPDREGGMIEATCQGIVHNAWQEWLEQLNK